jgi:cell division topological specificity factor
MMGVLDYLSLTRPRATASLAKERLQFVLAHERGATAGLAKEQPQLVLAQKRRATASVAKERLQFVLAHERMTRGAPDFLPKLQHELLRLVGKYVVVDDDALRVAVDRQGETFVLGVSLKLQQSHIKDR